MMCYLNCVQKVALKCFRYNIYLYVRTFFDALKSTIKKKCQDKIPHFRYQQFYDDFTGRCIKTYRFFLNDKALSSVKKH
jgi:hypothetical protein